MGSENRIRIIIAKLGLDGHDRGAKVLASMLQSEGYEVIYLGMYNTPEMLVQSAIQEDVDMIGVSYLSGEHLTLTPILMEELRKNGAEGLPVIIGGIVPPQDEEVLIKMGVKRVFRGSLVKDVANYLKKYFG